jgi:hypothetical protein
MLGRSGPGPVLVIARIPLIRASVVTRYLIAAEPAVMSAPAGAVMVALSRWVMNPITLVPGEVEGSKMRCLQT